MITIGVIMDKYTELYAWIWKAFGRESFTMDQFRSTFPTSQGPKVAHDLVKKGYLKRMGRGIYGAVEPKAFIEGIAGTEADYGLMESAGKEYAFCESTAVSIWTDGYYWTGFTKGFRPVHAAVRKRDLAFWKKLFRKMGVKYVLEGESRTLYGQVLVLHPREKLTYVERDGMKVVPLGEVVEYCTNHELVYGPALEYLDEKHAIGYRKREHRIA
jgi:hypothetical protein